MYELKGAHLRPNEYTQTKSVLLMKSISLKGIDKFYVPAMETFGLNPADMTTIQVYTDPNTNKSNATQRKGYLNFLLPHLKEAGCKLLVVADGDYYKLLTGQTKVGNNHTNVLPCKYPGYEEFECIPLVNYGIAEYDPQALETITLTFATLGKYLGAAEVTGVLGHNLKLKKKRITKVESIKEFLNSLHGFKRLSCDIEAFSLRVQNAGIGTISFATDPKSATSFTVDLNRSENKSKRIRKLLARFFKKFDGRIVFHNSSYDAPVLIYNLFMEHDDDRVGMRNGIHRFMDFVDDSYLLAHSVLNSTAKPKLGLEALAKPYLGAWSIEVKNIKIYQTQSQIEEYTKEYHKQNQMLDDLIEAGTLTKQQAKEYRFTIKPKDLKPQSDLLDYNNLDTIASYWIWNNYSKRAKAEGTWDFYANMLRPSLEFVWEMELMGLPISPSAVEAMAGPIFDDRDRIISELRAIPEVAEIEHELAYKRAEAKNLKLKKYYQKHQAIDNMQPFNPGSPNQLTKLLYEKLNLPILAYTKANNPSTKINYIKELLENYVDDGTVAHKVLKLLVESSEIATLISTFIPAFRMYPWNKGESGYWLNGSINLAGTQSGRMSGNSPNLMNLPSGSTYGKAVKECFQVPDGWILGAADFNALENRSIAIRTKDPNRIKVFSEGYDSHCLNTYAYWPDEMPDIDPTSVESINSIKEKYPKLRSLSKRPTFAFNYRGTWYTVHINAGIPEEKARQLEERFKETYRVTEAYFYEVITEACKNGYVTLAFGLRLQTPHLHGKNPYKLKGQANAISRSVFNADSQSYGLLSNRALIEFKKRIRKASKEIQESVYLLNVIHDAIYVLMRDDSYVIKWVNDNLAACMSWQEDPEIAHDIVKIGAELDIGYSWGNMVTLPNGADMNTIYEAVEEALPF